jgi:hypothetical protein
MIYLAMIRLMLKRLAKTLSQMTYQTPSIGDNLKVLPRAS